MGAHSTAGGAFVKADSCLILAELTAEPNRGLPAFPHVLSSPLVVYPDRLKVMRLIVRGVECGFSDF